MGILGCIDDDDCKAGKEILTPREITGLKGKQITQIFAGDHHSFAITTGGKLFGWGTNSNNMTIGYELESENKTKITHKVKLNRRSAEFYRPVLLNWNEQLVV